MSRFDQEEVEKPTASVDDRIRLLMRALIVGLVTLAVTVLIIGLVMSGLNTRGIRELRDQAAAQLAGVRDSLLMVRGEVASLRGQLATAEARADTARHLASALIGRLNSLGVNLDELKELVGSEVYLTSDDLGEFRRSVDSRFNDVDNRLASMNGRIGEIQPWTQQRLDELAAAQAAQVDLLRTSVDQRLAGMNWRSRVGFWGTLVNGAIIVRHVADDEHHR